MVALNLPKLTVEEVLKGNRLFGHHRSLTFALGGQKYTCTFLNEAFPESISHSIEFQIGDELDHERFWVLLHQSPVMDMFSNALADIHFSDLPEDIALIAGTVLMDEPLKFLAAKIGQEVKLASISLGRNRNIPAEDTEWHKIPFALTVTATKELFLRGVFSVPKSVLERFIRVIDAIPLTPFTSYDFLTLDVSIEVGKTRLSSIDYRAITSNDIILLDDPSTFQSSSVYCRLEKIGLQFIATFQENHLTVKSPMNPEETPPKPRATTASTAQAAATTAHTTSSTSPSLENFDLDLIFQVGQTRMSIKELKTLKPGYTFDLAKPISEAVTIVANGQPIGRGELLQIENHLGVRVIDFIQQ